MLFCILYFDKCFDLLCLMFHGHFLWDSYWERIFDMKTKRRKDRKHTNRQNINMLSGKKEETTQSGDCESASPLQWLDITI